MRFLTPALLGLPLCLLSPVAANAFDIECGTDGEVGNIPENTVHVAATFDTEEAAQAALKNWTFTDTKNALRSFLPAGSVCADCYDPWQCWEFLRFGELEAYTQVMQDVTTGEFTVELTFTKATWTMLTCDPCAMCGDCGDDQG